MIALLAVEARRALARRLVRALLLVALVLIVVAGVAGFFATTHAERVPQLTDLWPREAGVGGVLTATNAYLALGAFFCGASLVGAEWRYQTMATQLTWSPRRWRLGVAKIVVPAAIAVALALALQALLTLALLPMFTEHGSTAGADAAWARYAAEGLARGALLVGLAAALGGAIAMVGRNTGAALGVGFAYIAIAEPVVRAWKPWLRPWLVVENAARFVIGATFTEIGRAPWQSGLILVGYAAAACLVAVATLRGRDIAATS